MRLVIACCSVDYSGRLDAHLPMAKRLIMIKADGSVLIHTDGGSYKPANWMSAPCSLRIEEPSDDERELGIRERWIVEAGKSNDTLVIRLGEVDVDINEAFGVDPGLEKDGVESHLQQLLADQVEEILGAGWRLMRREYPTAIGPVDLLVRDPHDLPVAIEVKRRGGIDGVEQLTRYLELMGRDPLLSGLRGIFAAQSITRQARVLAEDRGIECLILDYDAMRGIDDVASRLF